MSKGKTTIADIAKSLGVSKASVSRALNGLPGVSEELREKIIKYTEESGYKFPKTERHAGSDRITGTMRGSDSAKVIGIVVGDIRNPFYSELVFRIQKELNQNGYSIMVFNSEYQKQKEKEFLYMAREMKLAGMVMFTVPTDMALEDFRDMDIPLVFVNRAIQLESYDSVLLDNYRAGYIAAMHLIELGHKRIGFISGPSTSASSMQRLEGFRQALSNYFLELDPTDIATGDLKIEDGYALAARLLDRPSRPTAIIAGNDLMALGVLDYCNEHGISVPGEISILGFDDIIYGRIHGVGLTSVSHHTDEMGRQAAELMIRRLNESDAEYRRIIQEPTLIVRDTTGRPKQE